MNLAAFLDALLAAVALWAAWGPGRHLPALRLGAALLAAAALLGALRFSGVGDLARLHQSMSMLAAAVGLPLLGVAGLWPAGLVARERRYAWIFAVAAGALCVLMAVMAGVRLWAAACSLGAMVAMLLTTLSRRQWWGVAASLTMIGSLSGFAAGLQVGPLRPGDMLHAGLAAGLLLYAGWASRVVRVHAGSGDHP